jgi:hypothetical protein
MVWVGINFPEDGVLPVGSKIRDALDALYMQVREVEWLRLVLLGLRVDVPEEVRADTTTETLKPLSVSDVATYFKRRWTEKGAFADEVIMETLAEDVVQSEGGRMKVRPSNINASWLPASAGSKQT